MLLDPMGTVAADVVVQDPGEHVCRLVQASMDSVWEDMGGGERRHVGALLLNTLHKAIRKKIKVQARESTALEDFEVVTGPSQLKSRWEAWASLVWEVRYTPFYTDDTLRQSARRVFQKFQPLLHDAQEAYDRAPEGKKFKKFLKTLKTKVLEDHCRWCKEKGTKDKDAAENAALKQAKAAAKAKPRSRGQGQVR